jgi:class 3 adenylate cyclase/tetratricopeptide (TPR) repeat protein
LSYEPKPIDTSGVMLPQGIERLTERLAENTHDVWARRRLAEGWRLGTSRRDDRKEHPGLVPYAALPEVEKQYDRNTALETLKAILALGYRIEPPVGGEASARAPGAMTDAAGRLSLAAIELDAFLGRPEDYPWDLDSLLTLWRTRGETCDENRWPVAAYRRISQGLAQLGDHLLAQDVAEAGLECWPGDVRLRQLRALALARGGDAGEAHQILSGLYEELQPPGSVDPREREETVGLLARTEKGFGLAAADPERRAAHLGRARELYAEGYGLREGSWTGINAAAMSLLLGEVDAARDWADRVYDRCHRLLGRPEDERGPSAYWPLATLGEAALIRGDLQEAEARYGQAAREGRGRWGDVNTTRSQARCLAEALGLDWAEVDRWFQIPTVVVLVGHMVDQVGRPTSRFPDRLVAAVEAALRRRLEGLGAVIGYASAACGSDLLFLQAVLGLQPRRSGGAPGGDADARAYGETHVVLPYHADQFRKDSVEIVPGPDWVTRYDDVIRRSEVHKVSEYKLEGGVSYEYANLVLHGLALIQAKKRLDTGLLHLAVWDGQPGDGPGGTVSTIEHWQKTGHDVEVLDLARLRDAGEVHWRTLRGEARAPRPATRVEDIEEFRTEILAIFFADVVGFSKLTEGQIPLFVQHFLGLVAGTLSGYETVKKNTWGDGLYFVFRSVREAGQFALTLRDRVDDADWKGRGFPDSLGLRIALHAGPVYHCQDPVTRQSNCIGTHVSHAARIEPITPRNQVYASQAFAAIAESEGVRDFTCRYVGKTPLAKGYGTYPTYHVEAPDLGATYCVDRRRP